MINNNLEVSHIILKSIYKSCWVEITHINESKIKKVFWISVKSIDTYEQRLICDSFSLDSKKNSIKEINIRLKNILNAKLLENTEYYRSETLIDFIQTHPSEIKEMFNDINYANILSYLEECTQKDTIRYKSELDPILGIDTNILENCDEYFLSKTQKNALKKHMSLKDGNPYLNRQIAINQISFIYPNDKNYVLAYKPVKWNINKGTLKIVNKTIFNKKFKSSKDSDKEFQIEEYFSEENQYLLDDFDENKEQIFEIIKKRIQGQKSITLSSAGYLMFIESSPPIDISSQFVGIKKMYNQNKVSDPIKGFFGELDVSKKRKYYPFCLVNNNLNPSQLLSIFTGLKDDVTCIQGPPGTGKTSTVINFVTTALFNKLTSLVVTNNNQPMKDLQTKFDNIGYYRNHKIKLPICRLTAKSNMSNTIINMNELYHYYKNASANEEALKRNTDYQNESSKEFVEFLNRYQEYDDFKRIQRYTNMYLNSSQKIPPRIAIMIQSSNKEMENLNENKFKEKFLEFIPPENTIRTFLYYYSAYCIQKLNKPKYSELLDIINIDTTDKIALDKATERFVSFISDRDNVKLLLDVFPIVLSTNLSAGKIGNPEPYFDICIMDEAAQCNIATSLIPIVRADKLILVGDVQQLKPVILLDKKENDELLTQYRVDKNYCYINNSIYSLYRFSSFFSKEYLLDKHYRCKKDIINFCNKKYYNNKLTIETDENGMNLSPLEFVNTYNDTSCIDKNNSFNDIKCINELLKNDMYQNKSIGIITPYVSQKKLIDKEILTNNSNVSIGTIHTFQGNEKDVIIFSSAITNNTLKGTYNWLKRNKQLINVAVSRAKEQFVFIGNKEMIEELHSSTKRSDKDIDDIYQLYEYVTNNGEIKIIPNTIQSEALGTEDYGNFKDKNKFNELNLALSTITEKSKYRSRVEAKLFEGLENCSHTFDFVLYDNKKVTNIIDIERVNQVYYDREIFEDYCREHRIIYTLIPAEEARSYFSIKKMLIDQLKKI